MNTLKKIALTIGLVGLVFILATSGARATSTFIVQQGGTGATSFTAGNLIYGSGTHPLQTIATTSASCSGSVSCGNFTVIGGSPISITGSGSGNVATSSSETSGYIPFWTSTAATPATLSGGTANFTWNNSTNLLSVTGNASTTQLTTTGSTYLATSGGNVGIGTTSPGVPFSVGGTGKTVANIDLTSPSGSTALALTNSDNGIGAGSFYLTAGNGSTGTIFAVRGTGQVAIGNVTPTAFLHVNPGSISGNPTSIGQGQGFKINAYTYTDSTTAAAGTAASVRSSFFTAPTYAATNYPVTTTDASNVYISGAPVAGTNELLTNSTALYIAGNNLTSSTTNGYGLQVNAPTGATNKYAAVFLGGNVGIGTTSPSQALDVWGSITVRNNNSYQIKTSAGLDAAILKLTSGNITQLGTAASVAALQIENGASAGSLYIKSNSNVGIGTTSPYAALAIGGDTVIGASTAGGTLGDLYLPKLGTAAGAFIAVDATGKVIATTTPSGGSGTVTSVGLSDANSTLTIGGTPVTTSGTLTATLNLSHSNTWTANQIFSSNVGIGSTTPYAPLSVDVASSTDPNAQLFTIRTVMNAVTYVVETIDEWGHKYLSGPTPVVTGCTSSANTGNDMAGTITVTTGASCTLTFAHAWKSAPVCNITTSLSGNVERVSSVSTTALVESSGSSSGRTIYYTCVGVQ